MAPTSNSFARSKRRCATSGSSIRTRPGGGQQLALIERFIVDTHRGTHEQFVTAFVLLARSLGFDARVATGFVVPPAASKSPLRLTSEMASVWPEVQFDDVGWVAFDPVPTQQSNDDDAPQPPPEAQTPAAAQPPIAPPTDDVDTVDDQVVDVTTNAGRWTGIRRWLVRGASVASISLLPFLLAIGAIVGLNGGAAAAAGDVTRTPPNGSSAPGPIPPIPWSTPG